jgi:predicted P-loop ATPase
LGTIENVEHMLKFYNVTVTYDVIKKDVIISIPGLQSSKDNFRNVAEAELVSLAMLNEINSANFERFIFAIACRNQVNPVMQWVKSKPWDEKDRISDLCATIIVADEFPNDFKCLLITKWLHSAIAAAAMPNGFSSRGVLTLQGAQGLGKTRWISKLINDEKLASDCVLLDHHMDPNNKDSLINACRHWIIEFGELDSSFRKDISRLKGFITNQIDKIRVPYAKRESEFPRRTVFAATVNDDEFLVDPTGNTRWFCLPCIDINHNHDIDMQQVWAQVYEQMFKGKGSSQWWLTDDEQIQLEALNTRHKKRTAIEDLLEGVLNFDSPKERWGRLSASDLLKVAGIEKPTNQQAKECANFLKQRIGQSTRSQGKVRWLVPPINGTFQLPKTPQHDDDEDDDKY